MQFQISSRRKRRRHQRTTYEAARGTNFEPKDIQFTNTDNLNVQDKFAGVCRRYEGIQNSLDFFCSANKQMIPSKCENSCK